MKKKGSLNTHQTELLDYHFRICPLQAIFEQQLSDDIQFKLYLEKGKQILGQCNKILKKQNCRDQSIKFLPNENKMNFQAYNDKNMDCSWSLYLIRDKKEYFYQSTTFNAQYYWKKSRQCLSEKNHIDVIEGNKTFKLQKLTIRYLVFIANSQEQVDRLARIHIKAEQNQQIMSSALKLALNQIKQEIPDQVKQTQKQEQIVLEPVKMYAQQVQQQPPIYQTPQKNSQTNSPKFRNVDQPINQRQQQHIEQIQLSQEKKQEIIQQIIEERVQQIKQKRVQVKIQQTQDQQKSKEQQIVQQSQKYSYNIIYEQKKDKPVQQNSQELTNQFVKEIAEDMLQNAQRVSSRVKIQQQQLQKQQELIKKQENQPQVNESVPENQPKKKNFKQYILKGSIMLIIFLLIGFVYNTWNQDIPKTKTPKGKGKHHKKK